MLVQQNIPWEMKLCVLANKSISCDRKLSIALCCKLPFFPFLGFSLWAQDVIHGNFTKVCPQGNFECC